MARVTIFIGGRQITIDAAQTWFWTSLWQAGEREATNDIRAGRIERFQNGREFLKSLE